VPTLPISDGFFESLGCHVLHLPSQRFTLCALPTIYNPHDLQHLHYPQFFTAAELARRETIYPGGCHLAETVAVGTQWIKDDVIRRYRVDPDKVQIIPWAAPTISYATPSAADIERVRRQYDLDEPFALYPAAIWPHKNHIRLLEATAYLRDRLNTHVRVVCIGSLGDHYWVHFWPEVQQRLHSLGLSDQVRFLGYVPEQDVRPIYRLAGFLVMPSLFEADSCPVHEAWVEGVPVACSNAAALPDQVGDAALLFDPTSTEAIAQAMASMAGSPGVRRDLVHRGHRRSKCFDWLRTARAYRAVYRRAARIPLSDEDRWLLGWDWMKDPAIQETGV
jgi:glycosyltransferase involved in cell wall biosynthesis